ncbi:MAG TPA: hypothetical protein VEL76_05630 [Gemmataceae bacterium]|nr:hypothetical protein [Gemmataceae bacterium]
MAKIGEGHLQAMARLGLKELRNAVNPSRESVADMEIGVYGTATQGEIAKGRGGPGEGREQESLTLDAMRADAGERPQEKAREVEQGREQQQNEQSRGMGR